MRVLGIRVISFIVAAVQLVILCGCLQEQFSEPIKETQLMLDTFCTITIYGAQDRTILTETFELCERYEALFSKTVEGSDVWRINNALGAPVMVSLETAEIIRAGVEYGELSGGMFDITIGRVSSLWDFSGVTVVPSENDLANAVDSVDYSEIIVEGNSVQLRNPQTQIDLGAIAKGYIADRLADFLRDSGVEGAVIDLGGNIVVVGERPDGTPWRVGVKRPFSDDGDYLGILNSAEASVVTSGVYERCFEQNGVLYYHILDPRTGMPTRSNVVGATVVSDSSMLGDVLSTIIVIIGSDAASNLLYDIPGFIGAVIVLEGGEVLKYGIVDFVE